MKFKAGDTVRVREDLEVGLVKEKNCNIDKKIKDTIKTWDDWKIDEYNNNFAISKYSEKLPYNSEKNCDNCKNYNTYFDCGQCEDFDEWEERINVEEFKPTKRKFWRLRQLHEEQQQLYKVKNQKYGDSFGISVQKYGLISALTRMSDKWNRIENLILNNDSGTDDESLIDSLKDLANYCNMTIIEIEGKHKY